MPRLSPFSLTRAADARWGAVTMERDSKGGWGGTADTGTKNKKSAPPIARDALYFFAAAALGSFVRLLAGFCLRRADASFN